MVIIYYTGLIASFIYTGLFLYLKKLFFYFKLIILLLFWYVDVKIIF